jgi:hypothetical protein
MLASTLDGHNTRTGLALDELVAEQIYLQEGAREII